MATYKYTIDLSVHKEDQHGQTEPIGHALLIIITHMNPAELKQKGSGQQ